MRLPHLAALCGSVLLALPATAQLQAQPGISVLHDDAGFAFGSTWDTLSDGTTVRFDGATIDHVAADGTLIATLHSFNPTVFASFVRVHPGETYALVGESANGDIWKVDLAGGTPAVLANAPFNFDLAWDTDPAYAYVSANVTASFADNDILRLDLTSGALTSVVHVDGPSGPIAVDDAGAVYYVTQYNGWPVPLGESDLLRWTDAQLDGGGQLAEVDAQLLVDGLNGGSSIVWDTAGATLLVADVNFQGAANVIRQYGADGTHVADLASAFASIGNLELWSGAGPQTFARFQPQGAELSCAWTDFGLSETHRVTLAPERAVAGYNGPGSGQSGPATVSVDGAVPGGSVVFMVSRSNDLLALENASWLGWDAPTFTAVQLSDVKRRTIQLPTDAAGSATLQFNQSAGLHGAFVFQAIVHDTDGAPLGTSTFVVNQ